MTTWKFEIGDPNTGSLAGELTCATQKQLTWYLAQPCTAQFAIEGRDPQAALIDETMTDLFVHRDNELLFRGRIGGSTDAFGGPPTHNCTITAVDYRGLLQRRVIWPGSTYSFYDTPQETIAWEMVSQTQSGSLANDLGIQQGIWPASTTYNRTIQFNVGDVIESDITTMAAYANGFDWEIDANKRMNLWYPNRGVERDDIVLDYGGSVVSGTRTIDTSVFQNAIVYTGGTQSRWDWCYFTAGSTTVTDTNIGAADTFTQAMLGPGGYVFSISSLTPGSGFVVSATPTNSGWYFCLLTGTQLAPVVAYDTSAEVGPPPGYWETSITDSSINDPTALQDAANGALEEGVVVMPSYQLVLAPGWWNPSDLWLGDTVRVVVMSGRLQVDTYLAVTQIEVTLGDEANQETVTITVGPVLNNLALRLRNYDARFRKLQMR